ncbi:MAG TPA: hypothetical protein VI386_08565 [Candidatus Sulfotelmatobacter sp.]
MKILAILRTFLFAVLVGVTALAYAQVLPDSLGTIQSSPITCQGHLSGGTCYALDITCPQLPNYTAYVKIFEPTVAVTGTVLFATGGNGTDLLERRNFGPIVLQKIGSKGYRSVELTFGFPFNQNEKGWQTDANGAGVRAASCRFATVLQWVHDNFLNAGTPLCAAGNSAGGQEIGEAMAHYGSADVLTFAEITSGPPFGRVDYACENTQAVAVSPCSGAKDSLAVQPATSMKYIDPAYPGAWCSSAYATHSTAHQTQFLNDSVTSPDAVLDYPDTFVNFMFGQKDTTSAIRQGLLYQGAITSAIASECAANVGHTVEDYVPGAQQEAADIVQYCKLPAKK